MTYDVEAHLTALNDRDNTAAPTAIAKALFGERTRDRTIADQAARIARMQARLDEASDILAAVQDHCQNCPDWDLEELVSEWLRDGVFPVGDPADDPSLAERLGE